MLLERIQELAKKACKEAFEVEPEEISVEFTDRFGDLAINCFYLARSLRMAPPAIAAALAGKLTGAPIASAEAVSGYVNVVLDDKALFEAAITPTLTSPATHGAVQAEGGAVQAEGDAVQAEGDAAQAEGDAPRVMVEFSSPNTNKPQHLGHVRNNCLGDAIARLVEASGKRVLRANLINDRGIHICKSMLAYEREGEGRTPESEGKKGDHFVGEYYVLFEKRFREEFETYRAQSPENADVTKDEFFKMSRWGNEAQQMLQLWEHDDEETVALWRKMNGWVIDGFEKTYEALGIAFDRVYLESETYKLGREIVEAGLERGVFYRRPDGAVEIDLSEDKLDKKVVLRSDGTSVYITQDIGTTVRKFEENELSEHVWVVGDEQIYHFKVLFKILERLGYGWAENCHHLAYGMVHLPEGKMKSREGKVVDADDLIAEVTELARREIRERAPETPEDELEQRAHGIGLAALKFMILSVSPQTTMTYDPKASVAFDGDTGPYVLYAFARIRRMVEDSGIDESETAFDAGRLGDESERKLALRLLEFPGVVAKAARDLNPSAVASYLLQLARNYHSHNRQVPILKAEDPEQRRARLALSRATAVTLERGLGLLGIPTVDRM